MRSHTFLSASLAGLFGSLAVAAGLFPSLAAAADKGKPIPIGEIKHEGPVDFEREVLPVLRRKCLACHNATEKESDLVLETPQTILKGGSAGPAVVAGKGAESLLIQLAAREKDPVMPPDGNDVKAKPLTSEELGLIKLWIDQGAKGEVLGKAAPLVWQPLPAGVNPIYSVAVSPDGQYAAAGRANQIFLYHVPSKREVGRLTDPNLLKSGVYNNPGVAHLDLVQSLAFSPDNELLASGGYKEVKFWKRARNAHKADLAGLEGPPKSLAVSRDGKFAAIGEETGKIKLFDLTMNKVVQNMAGHSAPVSSVCFSADGTKLISGSQDKTFRLWTTADGKQVGIHIETPAPVNAVALVGEDKQIATGNADNTIRLWDLPPAAAPADPVKPLKELKGHTGPITSLAIVLPAGAELVSGSQDGTVRVWNVMSGAQTKSMAHGAPVDAIAVRPDGKRIGSVSANNTGKLWNAENSQPVAELKGDFRARIKVDDVTRAVALSKRNVDAAKKDLDDATKRKTAEEENSKKAVEAVAKALEDFNKKTEAAKQPVADKEAADKALVDATAAKTKADEAKKLADAELPKATEALTKAQADATAATKAATDAAAAAKAAAEKLAKAQEAAKADTNNATLAEAAKVAEKESQDAAAKMKTADDAKAAADKVAAEADVKKKAADEAKKKGDADAAAAQTAFAAADAKVKQLAPNAQKVVDEKNAAERTHKAAQRSVERAAESVKAATDALPALDAAVKAQEEVTKQTEAALEAAKKGATDSEKPLKSIAFSPDGLSLATAGDDQMVHTWDAETGAAIESFSGQAATVLALGYTADQNIISAAQNNTVVVWDTNPEWTLQRTIGGAETTDVFADRVTALAFSADSKQLVTGGGEPSRSGEMKIWNVENGALVQAFKEPHSDTIFGLEFSPDGKFIASCGADRFVKVFEVAGAKFVRSFEGHTHHVLGVSWRADGRLLASCGADNVIKVWDVKTGDQARTIQGFAKEVTSIRFVADGDNVIASGGDNSVRLKNAANGGNVRDFAGATDFMYAAAASADGKVYAGGGQDSALRLWKDDGTSIAVFAPPKPEAAPAPPATK